MIKAKQTSIALGAWAVAITLGTQAMPARAAQILIDGSTLNGGFESGSGGVPQYWQAAPGTSTTPLRQTGNVHSGSYAAALNLANTVATDANYTVHTGDTFSLSFYLFGGSGAAVGDEINWKLFYTADNTLGGTSTAIASGALPISSTGLPFIQSLPGVAAAAADANGKELFLSFTAGKGAAGNKFYRIDDVALSVATPEPSAALAVMGLFALAGRRRRRTA